MHTCLLQVSAACNTAMEAMRLCMLAGAASRGGGDAHPVAQPFQRSPVTMEGASRWSCRVLCN